jgi:hypothetical protein
MPVSVCGPDVILFPESSLKDFLAQCGFNFYRLFGQSIDRRIRCGKGGSFAFKRKIPQ